MFRQLELQRYLYALKDKLPDKCSLYAQSSGNVDFIPEKEFWYKGFLFKDGRVKVYNILIYSKEDWDNPYYLDITDTCVDLLKYYNPFHAIEIVSLVLKPFFRENVLTENNYLHFKHYNPNFKSKRKYATEKHRHRQSKYIESDKDEIYRVWHNLLLRKAKSEVFLSTFTKYRKERPDSLYLPWDFRDGQCYDAY